MSWASRAARRANGGTPQSDLSGYDNHLGNSFKNYCLNCGYVFSEHRYVSSLGIRFCPDSMWKEPTDESSFTFTQLTLPFEGVP